MPTRQRWTFFTLGVIYIDLMEIQQGLIDNKHYEQRKFLNYFYGLRNTIQGGMQGFRARSYVDMFA
jgi:hypothetical protein